MEIGENYISIRLIYVIAFIAVIIGLANLIPQLTSNNEVIAEEQVINEVQIATENTREIDAISRGSDQVRTELNSDIHETEEKEVVEEVSNMQPETTNQNNVIEKITKEDVKISKEMDLTERTGLLKEDFIELVKKIKFDKSGFFKENVEIIYDLCEEYSINEIFFCGLISAESGWDIASNHRRTFNYISMMNNGKLIQFDSVEDGLEAAAKLLHNKYLTNGGSFYHGKTLSGVQKCFCPSDSWVDLVFTRMKQVLQ